MRWGITFLSWVLIAIYLASGCLDYLRVWQNPPIGYTQEKVLPYLTACGTRKSMELAVVTVVLVALYFASGWAIARFREDDPGTE